MKKCFFCTVFTFLIICSSSVLLGDVIELDNGSRIIGQIEMISEGKIHIKTDFAGTLEIEMTHVDNLSSDNPLFVAFTSGNRLYGKIYYNREQIRVDMTDGNSVVTKDTLVVGWPEGQHDPLRRNWKYEAGFDIAGKTGNSERVSTGGSIRATLEGPDDTLLYYLKWAYAKEDGDKTDDERIGGIDFERRFAERHSWYARTELERDDIEEIDLRATAALGYGYYFLNESDHVLRGRIGPMYRHESYHGQDSESTAGIDLGLYHMYELWDWGRIITDITYTPSIEDAHDYRIYHESALEVPLGDSDIWNLQLGVAHEYTSQPVEDNERLDTTYFSRLVLLWD